MAEIPRQSSSDPVPVMLGPEYPCPYLVGRTARLAYATSFPEGKNPFAQLLNAGFRRSGTMVYRTACEACTECRPLRIIVGEFHPDRSQRRAYERNKDLQVAVAAPKFDAERAALIGKYLETRHDGRMDSTPDQIEETLYRSHTDTLEISARLQGRLVVAAIADLQPGLLSLVYSAWDTGLPRRSLGTSVILWSVVLARRLRLPYVHLGFWVRDSPTMDYKANFRPHEVLQPDGSWRRADSANTAPSAP